MGMPLNRQGGGVCEPPLGGGRAKIENSSRRHPRKFGQKRFLAVRRSWRRNGVACFWATSLKIFGGVIAISYPLGREHGRHRAMRRLRLNRVPSFPCRDVYQDCTPTHLHWFRTGMIRSWQPQDAKAISIKFPTSILLLRSMQNLSPSYREADAMMIAGHGWKRVANTLLKITLPLAAAIGALPIAGSSAIAQTYPSQPIKVICPMSSGSPIDVTARVVTNDLSNRLGKPVIVENRPGGGGTIGVGEFTRAAPDGHTLLCGAIGDAFASKVIGRDPAKDFIPVATVV